MSSLINRKGFTFIELLVVIIAVILFLWFSPSVFNKLSELFNTNEPGYIRVTDIPGLTDYSKQILKSEDYVIVPDKIKVSPNQMLELYVCPVQGKLFSKQSILIKPQVQNLNQLLAEIKFTTDFYDSLTKTYIYSGIKGFFDVVVSIIKGFFSFIWDTICYVFRFMFHPIDSFRELFSTSKKVVTTVVKNPRVIVELPIDMANGFLDEVEIDIAKRNYIDIKKIYLKETLVSLRHKRNIEVGAQSITTVVGIFVPGSTVIPARVGAVGKTFKMTKSSVNKLKQVAKVQEKSFVKTKTLRNVEQGDGFLYKVASNRETQIGDEINAQKIHDKKAVTQNTERISSKRIKSGGPEDQAFDKYKDKGLRKRGVQAFEENSFQKGVAGISGKKPTPDGLSVDYVNKTKIYWEDKRPSEWQNNSWRNTYASDPIAKERITNRDLVGSNITKAEADAHNVIAEHDDHFAKKILRWNDPANVPSKGFKDQLGIRIPDWADNQDRIYAFLKELKNTGRNPEIWRENGVTFIKYDVKK